MKPKKFKRKLMLNKRTVANLNQKDMNGLVGGVVNIDPVEFTNGTVQECCSVVNKYWCITDPPTMCLTCPMTDEEPCQCGVVVDPVGDVGVLR